MKKRSLVLVMALSAVLCGCGRNGSAAMETAGGAGEENSISNETGGNAGDSEGSGTAGENSEGDGTGENDEERVPANGKDSGKEREASGDGGESAGNVRQETAGKPEEPAAAGVAQGGPYGEISIMLPDGWKYETFPMDSGELISGDYGIHFYPEGVAEGFVELVYIDFFGVCGTGLAQENAEIAGSPASIGTYDGHPYWDFVSFREQNDGVVALTYQVEDWWDAYGDSVTEILDTLTFDRDKKEGGAYVYKGESENQEIGLYLSLKNVSVAGATLIFNQFDAEAPTGELQDGDDFILERYRDGNWEEVPVAVKGDYGVHDIAYNIPKEEITERELSWEWLYGQLEPGEYRIGKPIQDFRKMADYDEYVIYAYFILE
ncbi:MAG TPA: hypothetical protein DCZ91_16455 [Lachnospiraceae bacterium]|nr:hypothetical protein [Lachnospiraceae bacterium]